VAVTGAEAAAKKKAKAVAKGPAPIARGCTYVQAPYCLGVSTSKGTYSLWNANPWIPPGRPSTSGARPRARACVEGRQSRSRPGRRARPSSARP